MIVVLGSTRGHRCLLLFLCAKSISASLVNSKCELCLSDHSTAPPGLVIISASCHDSTILFSLFMPTFFLLVYFTLSQVTLLSHGSHVQSHDGSPDLSHDEGT